MGTYTTNKNLFMPTVGEQGWGDLVNGNFETIDNFLKPISLSGSTYTFTGNQTGGTINATSITNSGTLTSTGKITANGGIGTTSLTASSTSTFTGKITANGGIGTNALTATSISNSGNMTNTGTLTSTGKIYANGGLEIVGDVVGNVVGKIAISSLGDEPNNLKVFQLACKSVSSGSFAIQQTATKTVSLSFSDYTLTKYNTSIINYVTGDDGMLSQFGISTCTIKVSTNTSFAMSYNVSVTDTTSNTTVLNTTVRFGEKVYSGSTSFLRNCTHSYSVTVTQTSNPGGGSGNSFAVSVPTIIKYVS